MPGRGDAGGGVRISSMPAVSGVQCLGGAGAARALLVPPRCPPRMLPAPPSRAGLVSFLQMEVRENGTAFCIYPANMKEPALFCLLPF